MITFDGQLFDMVCIQRQAAQELLLSLQEALPDETKNAISPYLK